MQGRLSSGRGDSAATDVCLDRRAFIMYDLLAESVDTKLSLTQANAMYDCMCTLAMKV